MADATAPYVWGATDSYEAYIGRWSRPLARAFLAWFALPRPAAGWTSAAAPAPSPKPSSARPTRARWWASIPRPPSSPRRKPASPIHAPASRSATRGPSRSPPTATTRSSPGSSSTSCRIRPPRSLGWCAPPGPGGAVGAYVWDYRGEFQLLRYFWEAATATDSAAASLDPRPHMQTCQPEPLAALFHSAGLGDVAVDAIDLPMRFRDLDDYWLPNTMAGASVPNATRPPSTPTGRRRSGSNSEPPSPLRRTDRSS